eukprot:gene22727-28883_t
MKLNSRHWIRSLYDSANLDLPTLSNATLSTPVAVNNRGGRYASAPTDFDSDLSALDGGDPSPNGAYGTPNPLSRARNVTFEDAFGESKRDRGLFGDDDDEQDEDAGDRYATAFAMLDLIDTVPVPTSASVSSGSSGDKNNVNTAVSLRNETAHCAAKVSEILLSVDPSLYGVRAVLSYAADKLLNSYTMEKYCEQFYVFERQRNGTPAVGVVEKLLSHQMDLQKTSLTSLPPSLQSDALVCSRLIHTFMKDKTTHRTPQETASSLLLRMLSAPSSDLHDEVYCQLMKQTRRNASAESTERGWQLMLICLITFPPSKRLLPFLFNYISTSLAVVIENAHKFVSLSLKLVLKAAKVSAPRKEIPTQAEIQAALLGEKTEICVYTLDKHVFRFHVDSYTTVSELETMVQDGFHIQADNRRMFALFEVYRTAGSEAGDEHVLAPTDRLLDLTATWDVSASLDRDAADNNDSYTDPLNAPLPLTRLLFKVRHYFAMTESDYRADRKATQLLYDQAVHHVLEAYYPYTVQDAVFLAALQLQVKAGGYKPGQEVSESDSRGGNSNNNNANNSLRSDLEGRVIEQYKRLAGVDSIEAQLMYLIYISSWKLYGSTLFVVKWQNGSTSGGVVTAPQLSALGGVAASPGSDTASDTINVTSSSTSEVVLAVGPRGLLLVDISPSAVASYPFLAEYNHVEIVSWGHSYDAFVLITSA